MTSATTWKLISCLLCLFLFLLFVCLFISILLFDSKKRSLDFSITQKLKKKKYTHVFSFCYSNYRLPVELMCLYMFIFFSSGCWFLANSIVLSLFFLSCLCICSLRTSRYSFIEIKRKTAPWRYTSSVFQQPKRTCHVIISCSLISVFFFCDPYSICLTCVCFKLIFFFFYFYKSSSFCLVSFSYFHWWR